VAIKNLLLPLGEGDADGALLGAGLELARHFDAHLTVLHVRPVATDLLPYATLGLSARMRATVLDTAAAQFRDTAARLRAMVEQRCAEGGILLREHPAGALGLSAWWVEVEGGQSEVVARLGRVADLIIMPRPRRKSPPPTVEAALRDTGRPLLLVPPAFESLTAGHIAVAWNGSKEVAQAVAAAGPFFAEAARITLLTTRRRMGMPPNAEALTDYLGWHGLQANIHLLAPNTGSRPVAKSILKDCGKLGVELLVIGSFSRARMRELVLGDVTQWVLKRAELPIFTVH